MTSPVISVYLGSDMKKQWDRYSRAKGMNASASIRQLINFLLTKENGSPQAIINNVLDAGKTKRIEIRLKPTLYAELQRRSQVEGFSPNRFITGLVDAQLTKTGTPVFGQYELDAITASTSQLVRLGTNLNQISRAINRNPIETDLARVELIQEIRKEINAHTQHVSALIEANLKRWQGGKNE